VRSTIFGASRFGALCAPRVGLSAPSPPSAVVPLLSLSQKNINLFSIFRVTIIMENIIIIAGAAAAVLLFLLYRTIYTVEQGTIAVITSFGKYKCVAQAGINFKNPISDSIFKRVCTQNKSMEIEFTAITNDQANVDFKAMLLYSTLDDCETTIKKVAFKFADDASFMQALIRGIEASIRAFVATKKQNEILVLHEEIINAVKDHVDKHLESWGYNLIDLQINDILFDEAIMRSMAQVVASENLKAAALNEGEAVYIKRTKEAEAEKTGYILKAEGMARMEETLAQSMIHTAKAMQGSGLSYNDMLVNQWMESMKHVAEHGSGNVIFFDGSAEGLDKTMRQMQALNRVQTAA